MDLDQALERPSSQKVSRDEITSLQNRLPDTDDSLDQTEILEALLPSRDGDVAETAVHVAALVGAQLEVMGLPGMNEQELLQLHTELTV